MNKCKNSASVNNVETAEKNKNRELLLEIAELLYQRELISEVEATQIKNSINVTIQSSSKHLLF